MAEDVSKKEERDAKRNVLLPVSIVAGLGFAVALVVGLMLAPKATAPDGRNPAPMAAPSTPTTGTDQTTTGQSR
jgi:hypothetical protein